MNDWGSSTQSILGNPPRRSARSKDCLSHAALDRLALGEAGASESEAAQAHLAACKSCAELKAFLERDRASFLVEANIDALAADALARASQSGKPGGATAAWWQRLGAAVAGLAAVATVAVLLPRSVPSPDSTLAPTPRAGGMTAKGGLGLTVYVLHTEAGPGLGAAAGAPEGTLHLGEPLHPGDRIRLQLAGRSEGLHALVLAVDQSARVSVYYAGALGAAGPQLLPNAIELDATLGPETIVALSCRSPIAVDAALAAVQAGVTTTGAGTSLRPGELGLPCEQARYVIKKVPR